MTEAEWLACTDPEPMLEYWRYRGRDRKLRLVACAARRRGEGATADANVLSHLEDEADSEESFLLLDGWEWVGVDDVLRLLREIAYSAKQNLKEEAVQAALIRDVFGNPFRPTLVDAGWLTVTVKGIAESAYNQRNLPVGDLDADRLAVLADALEDAGCTDAAILSHLRGPGPHVLGCWAVDLLLGKD